MSITEMDERQKRRLFVALKILKEIMIEASETEIYTFVNDNATGGILSIRVSHPSLVKDKK